MLNHSIGPLHPLVRSRRCHIVYATCIMPRLNGDDGLSESSNSTKTSNVSFVFESGSNSICSRWFHTPLLSLHILSLSYKLYLLSCQHPTLHSLLSTGSTSTTTPTTITTTSTNNDNDNDSTPRSTTTTGTTTFATLTWTNGPPPVFSIHLHSRLASLTFASQWLLTALYSCASVDFLAL